MEQVIARDVINVWTNLILCANTILNYRLNTCNIRRWWTKPHLESAVRDKYGAYNCIFTYFKLNDYEEFHRFVGMTTDQFSEILTLVRLNLVKRSRRKALQPELRLAATLNYFVHGNSVQKCAWIFLIGRSTMYKIIVEVSTALREVLADTYISFPSKNDLTVIAKMYWQLWHVPNCIGSTDGKHIRIKAPPNSGSYFFNFKKYNSIVLMGLCDAFCRFMWVNIGDFGSLNNAGIFQWSDLGQALNNGEIDLPDPTFLPGTDIECPYYIIGDGAFPLKTFMMKPYTRVNNLSQEEEVFNYRLSRARLTIERAFGILTKKWKILECPLNFAVGNTESIIIALICLHNFLITSEMDMEDMKKIYKLHHYEIVHAENELGIYLGENCVDALNMRNVLKDYFNSPYGELPWQYQRERYVYNA